MNIYRGILRLLGWKTACDFPDIPKSIIIMAPHTSYRDAVIGKIALNSCGIKTTLLTYYEYFFFPLNIGLKLLGSIPVGGKGHNAIIEAAEIIKNNDKINIVICPEGQLKPTDRWNPGFYYMAAKAEVPIVIGYLDYKKKEAGIKGVITDLSDKDEVFKIVAESYKGLTAKFPERFQLPKIISGNEKGSSSTI